MLRYFMALLFSATCASAMTCQGTDLRPTLTEAERQEIAQRIKGRPYPAGNHWIAERDGQIIHLIGTIHVNDPRLGAVADRLIGTLEQADHLFVEATAETETQMMAEIAAKPELAFLTEGPTLIDLLPEEAWQKIAEAAAMRGMPAFLAAKHKPWFLSLTLALPPCVLRDVQSGQKGLDARLIEIADSLDIPTTPLDSPDILFSILGSDPMEVQLELLQLTPLDSRNAEDQLATLMAQYFEETHLAAIETSRALARRATDMEAGRFDTLFDGFMRELLDARNRTWMEAILNSDADRLVVAVGAGHLGGEAGLLNLLQAQGYSLQRQAF